MPRAQIPEVAIPGPTDEEPRQLSRAYAHVGHRNVKEIHSVETSASPDESVTTEQREHDRNIEALQVLADAPSPHSPGFILRRLSPTDGRCEPKDNLGNLVDELAKFDAIFREVKASSATGALLSCLHLDGSYTPYANHLVPLDEDLISMVAGAGSFPSSEDCISGCEAIGHTTEQEQDEQQKRERRQQREREREED